MMRIMSREHTNDTSNNAFGKWLDDELRRTGVSRRELAEVVKVSPGTVNAWIGGYRHISERNADEVADFFGVPRNVVREMAGRPQVSGPVPGMIGLRGSPGPAGVTSVAFIPVLGTTPMEGGIRATTAELGEVMPFAAEYAARFKEPGIIHVTDDSLAHRGIKRGESLLVEQQVDLSTLKPGALVVVEQGGGHYPVYTWLVDEHGGIMLVPVSGAGVPLRYDAEANQPKVAGVVRSIFSVRSIE